MLASLARATLGGLAVLLLHWPLLAAGQAAAPKADGAAMPGFLWEARRGAERVLLFGAIHVGRPGAGAAALTERPELKRVEVIAFEANVFDAQASFAATQRWAMYPPDGPGLEAHVDPATLARLELMGARLAGGVPLCCRMKPWMVANTLVIMEAIGAGLNPAYGSEAQLYQYALATGKPVVEIEGVEAQLRLFDEAPVAIQVEYLRHALETIENGTSRTEIEQLVAIWTRGDAEAMERLVAEMAKNGKVAQRFVAERIVRGRHPKMVASIERFGAGGRLHLVVIGALHYFGPDGLLQALRGRGYALQRLR
jgi:hypothetical protein